MFLIKERGTKMFPIRPSMIFNETEFFTKDFNMNYDDEFKRNQVGLLSLLKYNHYILVSKTAAANVSSLLAP